jgi:hypothetical protein
VASRYLRRVARATPFEELISEYEERVSGHYYSTRHYGLLFSFLLAEYRGSEWHKTPARNSEKAADVAIAEV